MGRRLVLASIVAAGVYLALELLSLSILFFLQHASPSEVRGRRLGVLETVAETPDGRGVQAGGVVMHPYLGYVEDPARGGINAHGFAGAEGPFIADPEVVVVGITGGSLSQDFWRFGRERLARSLREIPAFRGRDVRVVSLGVWGWKQPQQLQALSYFLALGGRLDVLINIDGFNEIANGTNLEPMLEGRMHPAFPSPWPWVSLSRGVASPQQLAAAGAVQFLLGVRRELAEVGESLRWSASANLVWSLSDRLLDRRLVQRQLDFASFEDSPGKPPPFHLSGPVGTVERDEILPFLARLWMQSSLEMEYLARGSGFAYYHFLQPNQYVPGSKTLTAWERKHAIKRPSRYHYWVPKSYPLLREPGRELVRSGVSYHDLTRIFVDVAETIYNDECCHINVRGNEILADEIARIVRADFATDSAKPE